MRARAPETWGSTNDTAQKASLRTIDQPVRSGERRAGKLKGVQGAPTAGHVRELEMAALGAGGMDRRTDAGRVGGMDQTSLPASSLAEQVALHDGTLTEDSGHPGGARL